MFEANAAIDYGVNTAIDYENLSTTLKGIATPITESRTKSHFLSNKYDRLLLNYCNDNDFIVEVKDKQNEHILEILGIALYSLVDYLENQNDKVYELNLYLSQDIEIPEWRQFTIHIDSQIEEYEQREELWDNLIVIFDNSYQEYLKRVKNFVETEHEKDAYRKITLIVE